MDLKDLKQKGIKLFNEIELQWDVIIKPPKVQIYMLIRLFYIYIYIYIYRSFLKKNNTRYNKVYSFQFFNLHVFHYQFLTKIDSMLFV